MLVKDDFKELANAVFQWQIEEPGQELCLGQGFFQYHHFD